MTAHAFVQLLVFHAGDNPDFETEVHGSTILAHTHGLIEWAQMELDEGEFPWKDALAGKPMGFYSLMFDMEMDSWQTPSTPSGASEYNSDASLCGEYLVQQLHDEAEVPEETAALYKDIADQLWTKNSNGVFQFT